MEGRLFDRRYRAVKRLGGGGFGETYLAEDLRRPGNPICVVKQLHLSSGSPAVMQAARRLFASEAEVLEKLKHPQIPQLLAYFEEEGSFYLVQEFIDGSLLASTIGEQGRLSEAQVVQLLENILNILVFIHAQGVIHRDIKPSNLIRRHSDNKFVLIDFGAVKEVQKAASQLESDAHTVSIGTAGYSPSEQLAGRPYPNSDIYALGMTAIHAITGLSPSELPTDPNTGEFIWQNWASHISPKVIHVIGRMVRYYFRDRYQTASEALQELMGDAPVSIPVDRLYPVRNPESPPRISPEVSVIGEIIPEKTGLFPAERDSSAIALKRTASGNILILRQQAQQFQTKFVESLQQKTHSATVFHVYGIGGIGKTTLLRELQAENSRRAHFVWLSFDLSLGIETPLKLMAKLYEDATRVTKPGFWQQEVFPPPDVFLSLYSRYQQTLSALETQPVEGKGQVSDEQIRTVKQLVKLGFGAVGQLMPGSGIAAPALEKLAEGSVDAATLLLSEKNRWQQLLLQHQATRKQKELQALMLEPLVKLTEAFAEGLIRKAQKHPIVLVLDAYEKASPEVDVWLWRYLLANTNLRYHQIRLLLAGRSSLLKKEGWQRLHQDWQLVYEVSLNRFTEEQTRAYLAQFDICQNQQIHAVYRTTKGLPYYLNWIREQKEQGIEVDFSQGNDEISKVLLKGLDPGQKRVVQLIACCHWFDRGLLQFLIDQFRAGGDLTLSPGQFDYFEWLIQRDFVKVVRYRYCLDDVARDLFRLSLWQEHPDLFHRAHTILAHYFEQKTDRIASPGTPLTEQIENPDWCTYKAEFLYHRFFAEPSEQQRQFLLQLEASSLLSESKIMHSAILAIASESSIPDHPLLPHPSKEFLSSIKINPDSTSVNNATTLQPPES